MFERFTERARQVVVLAQDEARSLKHDYIGTEHILLGLLREEEGLAARTLASLGIGLEEVREQVARIVGMGDEEVHTGQIPFTPRAKKVLELALKEALALGHKCIGTEHVLLGLARENEGVAARILLDLGADAERVRDEVIRQLGGPWVGPSPPAPWRRFRSRRSQPTRIQPMPDEVRELFGGGNFAHLATLLPDDGSPHSVPLWTIVHEGRIAFFTQPTARKAKNLERDARVALSVVDRQNPYRSAWARGRVTAILEGEPALEIIDRISVAYIGEPFPMRSGNVYLVDVERSAAVTLPFREQS
ncbi:MAG TPA: Clp protease N-terminal domain-containing protein [Gaiellaceae bacterium]|nr:Clp protease N-terminal domain-containing protein [Gaiellaceae bacterium]